MIAINFILRIPIWQKVSSLKCSKEQHIFVRGGEYSANETNQFKLSGKYFSSVVAHNSIEEIKRVWEFCSILTMAI